MDVDSIENAFHKMRTCTNTNLPFKENSKYVLEREKLVAFLREHGIDEEKIKEFTDNLKGKNKEEPDDKKIEHYQFEIKFDDIKTAIDNCKLDSVVPGLYDLIKQNVVVEVNSSINRNNILYKLKSNLICRDNLFLILKESGEKMTDSEISEILYVLKGVTKIEDLPYMISFDDLFGDILRMEKEDKEINV